MSIFEFTYEERGESVYSLLYTSIFIISAIMLVLLVVQYKSSTTVPYILLFACTAVSNFGYMQLVSASSHETAIFANQTIYLGTSFSPFLFIMCLADLCKIRMKKIITVLFLTYGAVVFTAVSTIGIVPWYYHSVELVHKGGLTFLMKDYGPLHTLYPLYLLGSLILGLIFIIQAFTKKKDVSHVTSILLLIILMTIVVLYIVQRVMEIQVEIIPISYVFAEIGVLFLLRRISLYDVMAISTGSMIESKSYGFIIWDSNGKYLGGDEAAKEWFPELKEMQIDVSFPQCNTELIEQIQVWTDTEEQGQTAYFNQGEYIIEAKHILLKDGKNKDIHCVYLRDDTQQQKYTHLVEKYNENLARDVEEKTSKIHDIQNDIIISMASIVENRDSNTGGHIARTSDVVNIFVKHLQKKEKYPQLTPQIAKCIRKAAPLHDFGKIAIPDIILNKPGKFTDEEYQEMQKHSAKGADIVARILQNSEDTVFKDIAVNVAHFHHEKWDGSGYPNRIKEEEIPFEARVMALADVFDALVSKRVYKESFGYDKAFFIIEDSCGSHFDPELCKEFLECRPELEELYNSYED